MNTPHETPEAEVEALALVICGHRNNINERGLLTTPRDTAEAILLAGYRKADPARDAELRAEGAPDALWRRLRRAEEDVEHLLADKVTLSGVVTKQRERAEAAEQQVRDLRAALTEAGDES